MQAQFEHIRLVLLCKLGRTSSVAAFSNIPKVGAKLKHWSWIFNAVLNCSVLFAASAMSLAVRDRLNSGQSAPQKSVSRCKSQYLKIAPWSTQHKTGFGILFTSLSWKLQAWQVFKESLKQHQSDLCVAYSSFLCNSILFLLSLRLLWMQWYRHGMEAVLYRWIKLVGKLYIAC